MSYTDTELVRMNLMNEEWSYREVMRIVNRVPWWDDDDDTWNDVDKAAQLYRKLAESIEPSSYGFSDLARVDFDNVDWNELITNELFQVNLDKGREWDAGL